MGRYFLERAFLAATLTLIGLFALPIAIWLDLKNPSDQTLTRQAATLNEVVSAMRSYYSSNVVARVLDSGEKSAPRHDYRDHAGAIPIPATLSIELGSLISGAAGKVEYRFVSDYPFLDRPSHDLTPFELRALARLRETRDPQSRILDTEGG